MTFDELDNKMDALIADMENEQANLLVGVANTANAMIKMRIQQTGVDAKGNRFKDYSEWYKEYKTKKGKNKGYTDFSFTNRMWNNIQLVQSKSDENMAVITALDKGQKGGNITVSVKAHKRTVKGKTVDVKASNKNVYIPSNYEKLEKNTQRFGEILNLSKEEIETIREVYDNGIQKLINEHGL